MFVTLLAFEMPRIRILARRAEFCVLWFYSVRPVSSGRLSNNRPRLVPFISFTIQLCISYALERASLNKLTGYCEIFDWFLQSL
jgi:hypothetical protein